jgi:hypothetical protein
MKTTNASSFWERLVATVRGRTAGVRTEQESLAHEVQELDQRDANWYEANLIAGARQLLLEGNDFASVSAIYGKEITRKGQKSKAASVASA